MRKILFILFLLATPAFLFAAEPMREWKSKNGATLKAAFDVHSDSDPSIVHLINKDGQKYRIPFDKLSFIDQKYVTRIRKSLAEDFESNDPDESDLDAGSRGIAVVPTGNQYALLIGVNSYTKPIESLRYCVKDMELLADCLQKLGIPKDNIFLVTDDSPKCIPTGKNICRQIESITGIMGPEDQLIIAFSGHGVMVDGKSYLCPHDTDLDDINSIVPREWVFEKLERCRAKQKLFIIDACRNELTFGGQRAVGKAKSLEDPIGADTHGFVLMASCDKKQQSWEHPDIKHGVFTYFLVEGLSGAARDEDGYVTIMSLFHYTSNKTKKYVLREFSTVQVPTFRPGGEVTDFCLAKLETPLSASSTKKKPPVLKPGDRQVKKINEVEFAFRYCPQGSFMMGYEDGEHFQVSLTKGFWIQETEITQKQWNAVMGADRCLFKGENLPVENVSWFDCQKFCKRCSELGLPVQLPTEAQWEYACRAGSATAYFWGDKLNGDKANCNGKRPFGTSSIGRNVGKTTPVGSYPPNAWGVVDMHGNVREWCQDIHDTYSKDNTTDPSGPQGSPNSDAFRVIRGGCWDGVARFCRSASRDCETPVKRSSNLGFRVILSEPSPKE